MKLKILWLYDDILNVNSDIGNIMSLKYRLEKRNIEYDIDTLTIGDIKKISDYDLVYSGTGQIRHVKKILEDLHKKMDDINKAIENKTIFFLVGTSFYLFGDSYKIENKEEFKTLKILPHKTIIRNSLKRKVGVIKISSNLDKKNDIIGFENNNAEIIGVDYPLGEVINGNGNDFLGKHEGYFKNNFICTNIIGPVLPRNPEFTDFLIKKSLEKKYGKIELEVLDDSYENLAKIEFEKIFD